MKRFLIATNYTKDNNLILTKKLEEYIDKLGGTSMRIVGAKDNDGLSKDVSYSVNDAESYDCIIALGGDGTILKVNRDLRQYNIPIVGVNLGTMGFLTEVEPEQIKPVVKRLMADDYSVEERMNIKGCVYKAGSKSPALTDISLNDIVITRAGFSRVIGLKVSVGGKLLENYEADGVIVASPTGSTGYNLSAGGPIVSPKAHNIIITPISPHSLTSKSIVLTSEDEIEIEILKMRKAQEDEALISYDGQPGMKLSPGDKVVIGKASESTRMIKLFDPSFYEVLRNKIANKQVNYEREETE
ncbi:MAG: NAD(+)/NADH kinase [Lachnospiraceae bacterium]|jgi:NAD+ kinase|nr:NAD(+)/NADH kinase [Lachnospiraceae bacterium]